ncbi:MAG: DNA-directed RNA polymerase subunit K [Candidatus Helarchaeota archaeon]
MPKSKKSKKSKKTKTSKKPKKAKKAKKVVKTKKKKRKRKTRKKEPMIEEVFEDFEIDMDVTEKKEVPRAEYDVAIVEEYLVEVDKEKGNVPKIDPPYLTKYEKARIIGARALQISMSAPILIEIPKHIKDPIGIATYELAQRILPVTIRRHFPNGAHVDIPLKDFKLRYDEEVPV